MSRSQGASIRLLTVNGDGTETEIEATEFELDSSESEQPGACSISDLPIVTQSEDGIPQGLITADISNTLVVSGINSQHTGSVVDSSSMAVDGELPIIMPGTTIGPSVNGHQVIILTSNGTIPGSVLSAQENEVEPPTEPPNKKFKLEYDGGKIVLVNVPDNQDIAAATAEFLDEDQATIKTHVIHPPKTLCGRLQARDVIDTVVEQEPTEPLEETEADVTQAWFTTRDDKVALQIRGHSWKQGQWSKEEIQILQENIERVCRDREITDPTEIIFEMSKDERKDFYRNIAKGLNRPLFSVYRRVIRMYDQKNHIGRYMPEEIQKLKELRMKHGTDWATIGNALGRSASSVKDRCRLMRDTCNSGKWLPEEEKRLTEAVYELSGAQPGDNITAGLSWSTVAEVVGSRSEKQCRTKWLNYLNWKQKGGTEWTREDDFILIERIANSGAEDETHINWNELAKGWRSARSPQWLRGKWWSLKRHVPDYQYLSFLDVVKQIKEMNAQNFRGKTPSNGSSRPGRVEVQLERVRVIPNMTLAIPVMSHDSGQGDGDGNNSVAFVGGGGQGGQGAFFITQPQSNPAISFSSGNMVGDHIIVHTLPVNQMGEALKSEDNMTVQMLSPARDGITTSSDHDDVTSLGIPRPIATIQLAGGIGQSDEDLQSLAQSAHIARNTGINQSHLVQIGSSTDMNQSHLVHAAHNSNGVEINTAGVLHTHSLTSADLPCEVSQGDLDTTTVTSDLVMVSSTTSHFAQSSSHDSDLINMPLSDPMMTSDANDLIGSSSDIEVEKVHSVTEDCDVTPVSPSS